MTIDYTICFIIWYVIGYILCIHSCIRVGEVTLADVVNAFVGAFGGILIWFIYNPCNVVIWRKKK